MATKKQLGAALFVVFLATSIYFLMPNMVKIQIENTRTIYYVNESDGWYLAATEYVNLYDGTTKMRASSRLLEYTEDNNFAYVRRLSTWKDNISTIQTYVFDKNTLSVEELPAENMFECFNCAGKIVHYEIRDILYDGPTQYINPPFSFGHRMTMDWQAGAYYAKVFNQKDVDKIIIKYRPVLDHEVYSVRLFDPVVPNLYIENSTGDVHVELGSNLNVTGYDTTGSINEVCINITCIGNELGCANDTAYYNWNTTSVECRFNDSSESINVSANGYIYSEITNAANINSATINLSGFVNTTYPENVNISFNGSTIAYIPGLMRVDDVAVENFTTEVQSLTVTYSGSSSLYFSLPESTITGATINLTGESGSGSIDEFNTTETTIYLVDNETAGISIDQTSKVTVATANITAYPDFVFNLTAKAENSLFLGGRWTYTSNINDGDYSTRANCAGGANCYAYYNFSAESSTEYAKVRFKTGHNDLNYTLPSDCRIQDPIQFRITALPVYVGHSLDCYNGSEWKNLVSASIQSYDGNQIYEIALWRRFPNTTANMNMKIDTGSDGIYDYTNTVFNYSSSPISIDLNITAIQNFLDACNNDLCDVPIDVITQRESMYVKLDTLNIISTGNLSNPSIDSGNDNNYDWNYTGTFITTETADLNITAIQNYLDDCTSYPCDVPIVFSTDNPGKFTFNDIEVNFTINPISLNVPLLQNQLSDTVGEMTNVSLYVSADSWGVVNAKDLNIDYDGPQNYTVTSYYTGASNTSTVYVHFSNWSYDLPGNLNYIEFLPKRPTSKNVEPYGQSSTIPIMNITMSEFNDDNTTFYFQQVDLDSISCVNMTFANTSAKSNGTEIPNYYGNETLTLVLPLGWSTISIPLEQDNWSISSVLSSIEGNYSELQRYNNQEDSYEIYLPSNPIFSQFTDMSPDIGYYININSTSTLTISGKPLIDYDTTLYKGWNLIGYINYQNKSIATTYLGINNSYDDVSVVIGYNEYTYNNGDAGSSNLSISEPLRGYWINTTENITLTGPLQDEFYEVKSNISAGSSIDFFMWADYECNYTDWRIWRPYWNFKACCGNCVCD